MICHTHKFIFIHIPKTGGTSIESVFDPKAVVKDVRFKHYTLCDYNNLRGDHHNYFKFSFVRNPWDMTVSMYQYLWHKKTGWGPGWRNKHKHFSKLTFEEWVKHPAFKFPTIKSANVNSHLSGENGTFSSWIACDNSTVDFVGRFETLQQDFNTVCDKIGIPRQELPHINKTNHKHYTEYYDDETREIVAEKYARDIERFGYEFEE